MLDTCLPRQFPDVFAAAVSLHVRHPHGGRVFRLQAVRATRVPEPESAETRRRSGPRSDRRPKNRRAR
jgi:hypothetical protein